jgi:hypothetical protein
MILDNIITEYAMREARENSDVAPECIPAALLRAFSDSYEVKAYTDENQSAWLLVSKAERRFLLRAPLAQI